MENNAFNFKIGGGGQSIIKRLIIHTIKKLLINLLIVFFIFTLISSFWEILLDGAAQTFVSLFGEEVAIASIREAGDGGAIASIINNVDGSKPTGGNKKSLNRFFAYFVLYDSQKSKDGRSTGEDYWINLEQKYEMAVSDVELSFTSSNTEVKGVEDETATLTDGKIVSSIPEREYDDYDSPFFLIVGMTEEGTMSNDNANYIIALSEDGHIVKYDYEYGRLLAEAEIDMPEGVTRDNFTLTYKKILITDYEIILSNEAEDKMVYYSTTLENLSLNIYDKTLADMYLLKLNDLGFSLNDLHFLGTGYSDEEIAITELFKGQDGGEAQGEKEIDEEQMDQLRTNAEKYIKEFLRADIISTTPHKTTSEDNIKTETTGFFIRRTSEDDNYIDGGINFWRTKLNPSDFSENIPTDRTVTLQAMTYILPEDFKIIEDYLNRQTINISELPEIIDLYGPIFTLDEETLELKIFTFSLVNEASNIASLEEMVVNQQGIVEAEPGEVEVEIKTQKIDYKQYVKQYAFTFDFALSLLTLTENPEYCYHLATLARATDINLVICDEYDVFFEKENVWSQGTYDLDKEYYRKEEYNKDDDTLTTTYDNYTIDYASGTLASRIASGVVDGDNVLTKSTYTTRISDTPKIMKYYIDAWNGIYQVEISRKNVRRLDNGQHLVEEYPGTDTNRQDIDVVLPREGEEELYDETDDESFNIKEFYRLHVIASMWDVLRTVDTIHYTIEFQEADLPIDQWKVETFQGLLREEPVPSKHYSDENPGEDQPADIDVCTTLEDISGHTDSAKPDIGGNDVAYELPNTGEFSVPLSILADDRNVMYEMMYKYQDTFRSQLETGELSFNQETLNMEQDTNNYIEQYFEYIFSYFDQGKFREKEEDLPPFRHDRRRDRDRILDIVEPYRNMNTFPPYSSSSTYIADERRIQMPHGHWVTLFNQNNYPNINLILASNRGCTVDNAGCGFTGVIQIGTAYGKLLDGYGGETNSNPGTLVEYIRSQYQHWEYSVPLRVLVGVDVTTGRNPQNMTAFANMFEMLKNREAYMILFYYNNGLPWPQGRMHWLVAADWYEEDGVKYIIITDPAGRNHGMHSINSEYFQGLAPILQNYVAVTGPAPNGYSETAIMNKEQFEAQLQ